jgi:hypothetical protein
MSHLSYTLLRVHLNRVSWTSKTCWGTCASIMICKNQTWRHDSWVVMTTSLRRCGSHSSWWDMRIVGSSSIYFSCSFFSCCLCCISMSCIQINIGIVYISLHLLLLLDLVKAMMSIVMSWWQSCITYNCTAACII